MAELTRGTVFDRPWGRTLAALGMRGLTGQLALYADNKVYEIAFSNGAVVGASSPIASDAAVRVALTSGLVSTTQVSELARKQASSPSRDEVDLIAEHLKLDFNQSMRLRRRTIAQKAARSFSVDKGEFIVTDEITLPVVAGSELDVRAIIYVGARQNLTEGRLAAELGLFGTWFRLKPEAFEDLPQFGFGEAERPIIDQLMNGASLGDLESIINIDVRAARATLYALCAAQACNVEQTRGQGTTKPPPAKLRASDPGIKRTPPSQPPATVPTSAPPAPAPREKRATAQPLVAYRPGMRRSSGGSQPPPNTTQTPVDANRPMGAAGNTMPPLNARRAATTPPVAQPIVEQPRTLTSSSGLPRAITQNPTQAPGFSRTTTTSGSNPGVTRSPSGSNPGVARTVTPTVTPTIAPQTPRSTTIPPRARVQSATKLPGMQAPEVLALVAQRAKLMDAGADHYALLGVAELAPADEIRKVYFNLARALHPDRLSALGIADDLHVAHKVFAQLNSAFSVLSDSKRRSEYDALLGRGGEGALREEQSRAEDLAQRILQAEEAYKRAELALKRDDVGSAIADLKTAIELNPDEADFQALLAWAQFCAAPDKNTVARQTKTALERAIQRSPKAINPRFYLARVQRMLGHDKEALDLFRDVLFDKPNHFEAQSEVRAIETRLSNNPKGGGGGLFGRKR